MPSGSNPNSRANLRPAKKGEIRNPKGKQPGQTMRSIALRWLDELTPEELKEKTGIDISKINELQVSNKTGKTIKPKTKIETLRELVVAQIFSSILNKNNKIRDKQEAIKMLVKYIGEDITKIENSGSLDINKSSLEVDHLPDAARIKILKAELASLEPKKKPKAKK